MKKIAETIYTPFQNDHYVLTVLTVSMQQLSENNFQRQIAEISSVTEENNLCTLYTTLGLVQ